MNDLISRSVLLQDIEESVVFSGRLDHTAEMKGANKIRDRIMAAPAVDAVEVVRCKDCDCWDEEYKAGRASLGNLVCLCHEWSDFEDSRYVYTRPDEYCSRGERKTNEND